MTASHNPGGIDADFGIKYNCANGGPAPSSITDKIYEISKDIVEFKSVQTGFEDVDIEKTGSYTYDVNGCPYDIEIIDSTEEYFTLIREIFDLEAIKSYLHSSQRVINNSEMLFSYIQFK